MNSGSASAFRAAAELPDNDEMLCEHGTPIQYDCPECMKNAHTKEVKELEDELDEKDKRIAALEADLKKAEAELREMCNNANGIQRECDYWKNRAEKADAERDALKERYENHAGMCGYIHPDYCLDPDNGCKHVVLSREFQAREARLREALENVEQLAEDTVSIHEDVCSQQTGRVWELNQCVPKILDVARAALA